MNEPGGHYERLVPGLAMTQFKLDPTWQFELHLAYTGFRLVGGHPGLTAHRLLEEL
jgi:hypothetical protein